jgi:translation elongation factor P/translation initiation factor 5A
MDLESFETLDMAVDPDVQINEGDQAEYWKINEQMIIKRKA